MYDVTQVEEIHTSNYLGQSTPPTLSPLTSPDAPAGNPPPKATAIHIIATQHLADVLSIVGRRAHAHAKGLTLDERTAILRQCAGPWDEQTTVTAYGGGTYDTTDGSTITGAWVDFGERLVEYSYEIHPKGTALWFTPGVSTNGGCKDGDIDCISQLSLDCDGAGDWFAMGDIVSSAGLSYLVQRSSSHTAETPKWHIHLPLVWVWRGSKPEWRCVYRHCIAWFSAAAELNHDLNARPILFGFDHATDRLGQPWFPGARRREGMAAPETIYATTPLALDLHTFLVATSFDPSAAEQEVVAAHAADQAALGRGSGSRENKRARDINIEDLGPKGGLLQRAFRHAGWLGPEMAEGKIRVQCPWEDQYTTGTRFDSSTILFPAREGDDVGWFRCSHAHCCDRSLRGVLAALPPGVLQAAREELDELWGDTNDGGTLAVTYALTDLGNADRFIEHYGDDFRYDYARAVWSCWDGRRWANNSIALVIERAKETVRGIYAEAEHATDVKGRIAVGKHAVASEAASRVMAIEKLARSVNPLEPDMLDSDPLLLNVDNGTLDLRTVQLRAHRREDLITKIVSIAYDPAATCPRWEAFLDHIFAGNANLIDFVQRLFGYCLTGAVSEQVLVFFYGKGANGKTTVLRMLQAICGEYATQAAPELLLAVRGEKHPAEVADLKGVRVAVSTEIEQGRSFAEAQIKQLTGGDKLKARFMGENWFEFNPTHKLILAANHKPIIRGTDRAIWRRIRLVPFNVTIPDDEQDKGLLEKLQIELPGILAWAVRGCVEWLRIGLGQPPEVKDATSAYKAEMDVLAPFFEDCCVVAPNRKATAADLYAAYVGWCEENGERPKSARAFGLSLQEKGLEHKKSNGVMVWFGVGVLGGIPMDHPSGGIGSGA